MYNYSSQFYESPVFTNPNLNRFSNKPNTSNSFQEFNNKIKSKTISNFNNMNIYDTIQGSKNKNNSSNMNSSNNKNNSNNINTYNNKNNCNNINNPNNLNDFKGTNEVLFEIFGQKIYFDDVLIVCILLFLYQEGIQDEYLFISLILLLLS